jgi:hypothetical protein
MAEEARKIMKVGFWFNEVKGTLKHLGLPPSPTDGRPGFLVWETDGKKTLPAAASDSHPAAYCMVPLEAAPASALSDRKRDGAPVKAIAAGGRKAS